MGIDMMVVSVHEDSMSEDGGQPSVQLLDYQMRELEKYRTAVHKMGQDILTLRQQVNKTLLASDVS